MLLEDFRSPMSFLVTFDPGKEAAGVAVFLNGELQNAFLARGKTLDKTVRAAAEGLWPANGTVGEVIVELPQSYAGKSKGDQNDLVDLALCAGIFLGAVGMGAQMRWIRPREWKGQVPGDVMIERIKSKLSKEEMEAVNLPPRAKSL